MYRTRPDYYEHFTCIADHCPITCCQEWKIAVDANTNRKWKKVCPPETVKEKKKNLSAYTIKKEGLRIIELTEGHRCPFLDGNKLCRLVSAYGDQILSETCTTFPREVHRFPDHEEETLMPCCPAVIDLWNTEAQLQFPASPYKNTEESCTGISDSPRTVSFTSDSSFTDPLLFEVRTKCIERISDSSVSLENMLLEIFYILHELLNKQTDSASLSTELICDYFSPLTAGQLQSAISEVELSVYDMIIECNELFQDLSVNYKKEGLYLNYLDPVLNLAEHFTEHWRTEDELIHDWKHFQKSFQKYDSLFRNYIANELYSDLLIPGSTLEDMLIQMQWIAMEYSVIRHSLFLKWRIDSSSDVVPLPYETVRDYLVIISRMTGYEQSDIYEYLENSFESLVWDWGYFALITGKK